MFVVGLGVALLQGWRTEVNGGDLQDVKIWTEDVEIIMRSRVCTATSSVRS